jgi:hypothetical protein
MSVLWTERFSGRFLAIEKAARLQSAPPIAVGARLGVTTAWAEPDGLTRAEPLDVGNLNCVTSQLFAPPSGSVIYSDETRNE